MVEMLFLPCVTSTPSGSHAWTVHGSLQQGLFTLIFCCPEEPWGCYMLSQHTISTQLSSSLDTTASSHLYCLTAGFLWGSPRASPACPCASCHGQIHVGAHWQLREQSSLGLPCSAGYRLSLGHCPNNLFLFLACVVPNEALLGPPIRLPTV